MGLLEKAIHRGDPMPRLMFFLFLLFALPWPVLAATDEARVPVAFTQADRDRLIRLEATLETFMHQVDKRFEAVDKRFEGMDKRFESFQASMDKRFEEVHNRLNDLFTFLWILSGVFTAFTVAIFGFAWWDRRTIIKMASEDAAMRIEKEGRVVDLVYALRELSQKDDSLREVLRKFRLL
jgi:nitrate reductase NapE component